MDQCQEVLIRSKTVLSLVILCPQSTTGGQASELVVGPERCPGAQHTGYLRKARVAKTGRMHLTQICEEKPRPGEIKQ